MTTPDPKTAEQVLAEQAREYGQYVATGPIFVNGARAFNKGDAVPASHIERGVVAPGSVAKVTTKAGREAAG
jgi:hypothetical protein